MTERRCCPRQRVLKAATIEFNRAGGISCTVRNLSSTGACVEVASPLGIPASFDLLITSDHAIHRCRMVWHSEHRIGVSFEQTH
jgi:hypothetical protein